MTQTKTPNAKTIKARELAIVINSYLMNAIDYSGYTTKGVDQAGNVVELPVICRTPKDKVNFVMSCFKSEYIHNNNRKGNMVTLFSEWLQRLPSSFNVDYENYRIIEIAKEWGTLPANATERQEDKIIGNWFNYIANKFFQLHKRLNNAKD